MNIYIETYGCAANQNNSEILAGILTSSKNIITTNLNLADLIIFNTCVVKGKTENKIKRRIQDISKLDKKIIVTGCMAQTDFQAIKKLNPRISVLGIHHTREINNLIRDFESKKLTKEKQEDYLSFQNEEKIKTPKISSSKLISITQISEGCLGNCSYCKTKLAKGNLFSYPEKDILSSIESDLKNGAKEIWLTSQDLASYGLDWKNAQGNSQLPNLLKKILSLKHKFKLRLGMMNPNNVFLILDELLSIFEDEKVYKFLHIPIQSNSEKVLKSMRRPYSPEIPEKIISEFRKKFPSITIATDLIVGYPNETNEEFKKTLTFIKEKKPDVLNLSKFSLHKGTSIYEEILSKNLKLVSIKIVNKRNTEIMEEHRKTALENKKKFLGSSTKVFVNRKISEGIYESRDENYNIVLINSNDKSLLGKFLNVMITKIGVHHMFGELE